MVFVSQKTKSKVVSSHCPCWIPFNEISPAVPLASVLPPTITTGSPSPNHAINGYWEYQYDGPSYLIGQSNTLYWGTAKTEAETETSQWSQSITAAVEAGFSVEGVSGARVTLTGTQASSYAQAYAQTWNMSQLEAFDIECTYDDELEGDIFVWQWKFDITDSFGNNLESYSQQYALTMAMDRPPQCQPGYNTDAIYQECQAGLYLPGYGPPGYGPTSTRRNLRAASKK
jgi:hypothetical protein